MGKVDLSYYASDCIPELLFTTESDAIEFDEALDEFCRYGREEYEEAAKQYVSSEAIDYAINVTEKFHFNLTGPYSERLILACENSIEDNPYRPALNYYIQREGY